MHLRAEIAGGKLDAGRGRLEIIGMRLAPFKRMKKGPLFAVPLYFYSTNPGKLADIPAEDFWRVE